MFHDLTREIFFVNLKKILFPLNLQEFQNSLYLAFQKCTWTLKSKSSLVAYSLVWQDCQCLLWPQCSDLLHGICVCHTATGLNSLWPSDANIDRLVQERCNSIANALELRLSCTNPSICAVLSTSGGRQYRRLLPCDPSATFPIVLENST